MSAEVSIIGCSSYEQNEVRGALQEALAALGGIESFVKPGMRVLLKPNLLSPSPPEKAITTHPVLVKTVAEMVKEAGGEVWIGDSPGGTGEDFQNLWSETGMGWVASETQSRLLPLNKGTLKSLRGKNYLLSPQAFEADLIINLPKLKTHTFTLYTGAVKNLFGLVPGTRKKEIHLKAPSPKEFARALVDILELTAPRLTIMDGILGQEGFGPGAGGTPRKYGMIGASADPVALDLVLSQAMGCHGGSVLHLAEAKRRRWEKGESMEIKVMGEKRLLDWKNVKLPPLSGLMRFFIPGFLSPLLERLVYLRPRVDSSKCSACTLCAQSCPAGAISPGNPPEIDRRKCTGCLCCQEICPQGAISPIRSPLARLAGIK